MSLADDLLEQADALLKLDPTRPRQVNLRGAVSRAYYAIFHLLVSEAAGAVVGSDETLRNAVARWYGHGRMREVCNWFRRAGTVPQPVAALLGHGPGTSTGAVPPDLVLVATAFVELQDARHRADYDVGAVFTRTEAKERVESARRSFARWRVVRGTPLASLFTLLLLTGKEPIASR